MINICHEIRKIEPSKARKLIRDILDIMFQSNLDKNRV